MPGPVLSAPKQIPNQRHSPTNKTNILVKERKRGRET